jgi:hypothetical protein
MTAVVRTPRDAIDPGVVESMDDDPHPLRGAVGPLASAGWTLRPPTAR